jgi:hypothetical protein
LIEQTDRLTREPSMYLIAPIAPIALIALVWFLTTPKPSVPEGCDPNYPDRPEAR